MLLIVLGMSRSGTSLLMQVLHDAGFDCGSDFIAANENNPQGYFERLPVMSFNINLLEEAAQTSNTLFPLPSEEQIEALAGQKKPPIVFPQHDYAIKDPRFSLTLPVWLPHLNEYDVRIIFARRQETAIVESLLRAYNLDMQTGRAITKEYLTRAQQAIKRYPLKNTEIHYEDWFNNPERNIRNLEELIGRPLQINLDRILHPELWHCKGTQSEKQKQDDLPEPYQTIQHENLFCVEQFRPSLYPTLQKCVEVKTVHIENQKEQTINITISSNVKREQWVFDKEIQSNKPPFNRYHAYNPKQQWLIVYGIFAFSPDCLDTKERSPLSPIVVIEPDPSHIAVWFTIRPLQKYLKENHVYFFLGSDADERFLQSLDRELKPYFIASKAVHFIADPTYQQKPGFSPLLQQVQAKFMSNLQQVAEEAKRFQTKYTQSPQPKNKKAMIVIPSVSCWITIGQGLAQGFRELGYDVVTYHVDFPPSTITAFESLKLLWRLYQLRPDFLFTLSHSSDLFVRGIKETPIRRIVWYVDQPGHLMQVEHNPHDEIIYFWREFEEPLAKRGGTLKGEVPLASAPMASKISNELTCEVGFVGTIHDTSVYRSQMLLDVLNKIDALVDAKLNNMKSTIDELMQQFAINQEERAHIVSAAEPYLRKFQLSDEQLIIFYIHIECIQKRRLSILMQLKDFDLKIFGNPDWATLLQGTAIEKSFQARGLPNEECNNFYRSAKISINIHPPYLHSAPAPRDLDIPMCGGFVLSDVHLHAGERLAEFFEEGKEIITYNGPDDIAEKVQYYLNHPEERQAVTKAAQKRILSQHTYKHRIQQMKTQLGF